MDTDMTNDAGIAARLRRLEASSAETAAPFGYDGLMDRHAARQARSRRRLALARGTAGALVVALVGASVWRLDQGEVMAPVETATPEVVENTDVQPRIVRADTYFAVAALEDHIARVDDALSVARAYAPRGDEVARLERARAELIDSYAQVRYAEMVSANF
jgi:hypothetical protein